MSRAAAVAMLTLTCGCDRFMPGKESPTPPPVASPLEQGRALLEQGQLDAALAHFQNMGSDPDALCYQGIVWAKKAEMAPLPTPPPTLEPLARGAAPPPAPEFKPEELTALELLERALAARPDHPRAHQAVAELLAPHAAHRHDLEEASRGQRQTSRRRRGPTPTPPPTPEGGPDYGVDRVLKHFRQAVEGDPTGLEALEGLLRFSERVGRLDEAEGALGQLVHRRPEDPEPFIRYGDFLANARKAPERAVEQYKQALVWRADDEATRNKIAEIYIAQGVEHWQRQQYALADARFKEAQKYVTDRNSPLGLKLQDHVSKLREIRPPR